MIQHDTTNKTIVMENKTLRIMVGYSDGVVFEELSNVKAGGLQNCNWEAFFLSIYGKTYCSKDFTVVDVTTAQDQVLELATLLLEQKEEQTQSEKKQEEEELLGLDNVEDDDEEI